MARRDDDPVHPNLDGIAFRPSTDRKNIVVMPRHADATPPYSVLAVDPARALSAHLERLIDTLRQDDAGSYAALFFEDVADDLNAAIGFCVAEPPQ